MPYGAEVHKTAHVAIELPRDGAGYDVRRARLSSPSIPVWAAGRLTLTKTHLSCIATRTGAAGTSFSVDLLDVAAVSVDGGLVPKVVTVTLHDGRRIHLRTAGAAAYAKRIAISREAVQRRAGSRR